MGQMASGGTEKIQNLKKNIKSNPEAEVTWFYGLHKLLYGVCKTCLASQTSSRVLTSGFSSFLQLNIT